MRFGTKLEVRLDYLAQNFNLLRSNYLGNQEIIFMVKANAYGHGLVPITEFAKSELQVKEFGVATLGEALELYKANPGFDSKIIIFSDHGIGNPDLLAYYTSLSMIPIHSDIESLQIFLNHKMFRNFPLYLKFNTGMNRLGLNYEDLEQIIILIKKSGRKNITHLMSHFACSYLKHNKQPLTEQQYKKFMLIKKELRAAGLEIEETSMANSGAIETRFALNESHVRPGLMLYGPSSLMYKSSDPWQGKIISELKAKIISKRAVKKGDVVGYGASHVPADGVVVALAIGYGDGWSTHMRGINYTYEKQKGVSLGRVNMDLTTVFFEGATLNNFKVGSKISLWDDSQSRILNLSSQSGSIPYELFSGLNVRLPRKYVLE